MKRQILTLFAAVAAITTSPALASHTIDSNNTTNVAPIAGTFGEGGGMFTDTLGSGELDFYSFFGTVGDSFTIATNPVTGQFDTGLTLVFNGGAPIQEGALISSLSVLADNDDGGAGLLSLINFNATQTGFYSIAVGGFGGDSGTYNLSLSGNTGSSAVPEPATWAMLLLGFFGIGGTMRVAKSRQKATVSYS